MRHKIDLTDFQKEFITDNWQKMCHSEMADKLNLKSPFKIQKFCAANSFKTQKKELTEPQKQFIRENLLGFREKDLAVKFKVRRTTIQQFKRSEGLTKYRWNEKWKQNRRSKDGLFNVNAYENWVM